MNMFLLLSNGLSASLVLVCWWLSHQNAIGREPYGRTISGGYSLLAMVTLGNILFQGIDTLSAVLPWSLLASKAVLVFTLGAVSVRLAVLSRPD